jgi:membrane fusion protein (multidrug efflux system)
MSTVQPQPDPKPPRRRRRRALLIAGVVVLGVVVVWVGDWLIYRFTHSISKDAFIETHLINVAPQVAGEVVAVHVQEQTPVKKGQLLALIDPTPYQREVDLAAAKREVAEAALRKAEADLKLLEEEVPRRVRIAAARLAIAKEDRQKAADNLALVTRDVDQGIVAAERAVESARATLTLAEEDYNRYSALFAERSVSERKLQEATKAFKTAKAEVQIAEAKQRQAEATRNQIKIATRQAESARHAVTEAEEALELARLGSLQIEAGKRLVAQRTQAVAEARRALERAQVNLDYTRVTAPYDGIIARKWRHLGDFAHTGEPIFSMYNPELLYVTVHLEETLLEGVRPGNPATLHVDALSRPLRGRVLWVGSATGANFSLIPRDVSSGEFTYVVQRVPTRIWIEKDERWPLLKPGLSVRAAICHGPGDPEWAAQRLREEAVLEGVTGP